MEISGNVKVINPEQQISATFRKRELVVTTEEQYPQHILIEFTQDKCDLLNNYAPGQPVKVSINIQGREWVNPQGETKYFNSIKGWRIESLGAAPASSAAANSGHAGNDFLNMKNNPQEMPSANSAATNFNEEDHDDLPF